MWWMQIESLRTKHREETKAALIAAARKIFATEPSVQVDYVELVDWDNLQPVDTASPGSLFAVAAWVGATRLIDNTILS